MFSAFVPDCMADVYKDEGRQYGFPQHAQLNSLAATRGNLLPAAKAYGYSFVLPKMSTAGNARWKGYIGSQMPCHECPLNVNL